MSWLSKGLKKLGKGAKKLVTNPGDWAKSVGNQAGKAWEQVDDFALPAIGFALGGPGGAALGGAAAAGIGDGRPKLGKVAMGAASGYLGGGSTAGLGQGLVQGAKQIGQGAVMEGVKGIGKAGLSYATGGALGGGGAPAAGGFEGFGSFGSAAAAGGGGGGGLPSGLGGLLRGGLDFAKNNPDLLIGALGAYQSAKAGDRADDFRARALGLAEQDMADRAPIRQAALGKLLALKPHQPNVGALDHAFHDPGNPYSQPMGGGAGGAPMGGAPSGFAPVRRNPAQDAALAALNPYAR